MSWHTSVQGQPRQVRTPFM